MSTTQQRINGDSTHASIRDHATRIAEVSLPNDRRTQTWARDRATEIENDPHQLSPARQDLVQAGVVDFKEAVVHQLAVELSLAVEERLAERCGDAEDNIDHLLLTFGVRMIAHVDWASIVRQLLPEGYDE